MEGAVLVFLPGWDDIGALRATLTTPGSPFSSARYSVLPLHSQIAPAEQRRVFQKPPAGSRKIVLATNVAETAVTIEDVVFVINSGRVKEKSYDPYTGVSTLQARGRDRGRSLCSVQHCWLLRRVPVTLHVCSLHITNCTAVCVDSSGENVP
jgi:Helicase conserved C-terminal domain